MRIGAATRRAVSSVREIATLLGASSPATTCSTVIRPNASAAATAMPPTSASAPSIGSSSFSNALSPTTPSPMLAIVMPSWHAAR